MTTQLVAVPLAEKPALAAAMVRYLAEIAPEVTPPGRYFDSYWQERDRWVGWITAADSRAGFAMVRKVGEGHELAEFTIFPAQRRQRLGLSAAVKVFTRFPGPWQLGVARLSPGGIGFWKKAARHAGATALTEAPPQTPHQSASLHFVI